MIIKNQNLSKNWKKYIFKIKEKSENS